MAERKLGQESEMDIHKLEEGYDLPYKGSPFNSGLNVNINVERTVDFDAHMSSFKLINSLLKKK
ncbi:MAG: hypothetical protein FWC71_05585 [Defluviitaleaceae bacterium]|nr:hypothetical protein [Defluviitaleaceae bacterium]